MAIPVHLVPINPTRAILVKCRTIPPCIIDAGTREPRCPVCLAWVESDYVIDVQGAYYCDNCGEMFRVAFNLALKRWIPYRLRDQQ